MDLEPNMPYQLVGPQSLNPHQLRFRFLFPTFKDIVDGSSYLAAPLGPSLIHSEDELNKWLYLQMTQRSSRAASLTAIGTAAEIEPKNDQNNRAALEGVEKEGLTAAKEERNKEDAEVSALVTNCLSLVDYNGQLTFLFDPLSSPAQPTCLHLTSAASPGTARRLIAEVRALLQTLAIATQLERRVASLVETQEELLLLRRESLATLPGHTTGMIPFCALRLVPLLTLSPEHADAFNAHLAETLAKQGPVFAFAAGSTSDGMACTLLTVGRHLDGGEPALQALINQVMRVAASLALPPSVQEGLSSLVKEGITRAEELLQHHRMAAFAPHRLLRAVPGISTVVQWLSPAQDLPYRRDPYPHARLPFVLDAGAEQGVRAAAMGGRAVGMAHSFDIREQRGECAYLARTTLRVDTALSSLDAATYIQHRPDLAGRGVSLVSENTVDTTAGGVTLATTTNTTHAAGTAISTAANALLIGSNISAVAARTLTSRGTTEETGTTGIIGATGTGTTIRGKTASVAVLEPTSAVVVKTRVAATAAAAAAATIVSGSEMVAEEKRVEKVELGLTVGEAPVAEQILAAKLESTAPKLSSAPPLASSPFRFQH
jgi:hypothetical protein